VQNFPNAGLLIGSALLGAGSTADDAAACAVTAFWVIPVVAIGLIKLSFLTYYMVTWVLHDARNRGMDQVTTWAVLVGLTNFVGFFVYLMSRPVGNLYPCPGCGKPRLIDSEFCPHCGKPSLA
jgi:hypothetical protein